MRTEIDGRHPDGEEDQEREELVADPAERTPAEGGHALEDGFDRAPDAAVPLHQRDGDSARRKPRERGLVSKEEEAPLALKP
jgi:hypothetical protein